MASASAVNRTIRDFTLVLSEAEARTLRDVVGRVGGSPAFSRRRYTDAIIKAFASAGVDGQPSEEYTRGDADGTITFKEERTTSP